MLAQQEAEMPTIGERLAVAESEIKGLKAEVDRRLDEHEKRSDERWDKIDKKIDRALGSGEGAPPLRAGRLSPQTKQMLTLIGQVAALAGALAGGYYGAGGGQTASATDPAPVHAEP